MTRTRRGSHRAPADQLPGPLRRLLRLGLRAGLLLVAVVVLAGLLGFRVHLLPALGLGCALTVLVWTLGELGDWPRPPGWPDPASTSPAVRTRLDPRTRQLQGILAGADQRRRISDRQLREILRQVVADRVHELGCSIETAGLSPGLVSYLRDDPPPPLSRQKLTQILLEVDRL